MLTEDMTPDFLSAKVVPCALATALDIGLSNLSLKTITLTFYSENASYWEGDISHFLHC